MYRKLFSSTEPREGDVSDGSPGALRGPSVEPSRVRKTRASGLSTFTGIAFRIGVW